MFFGFIESYFEREKNLKIQKIEEAISQQKELHLLKMEIGKAEKLYWEKKL